MSKIEKELQRVTKVKPKSGEDLQEYFERLAMAMREVSDKAWDSLSEEAQEWSNEASEAVNAGDDIPPFSDLDDEKTSKTKSKSKAKDEEEADEEPESESDEDDQDEEPDEEPAPKSKKKKVSKSDDDEEDEEESDDADGGEDEQDEQENDDMAKKSKSKKSVKTDKKAAPKVKEAAKKAKKDKPVRAKALDKGPKKPSAYHLIRAVYVKNPTASVKMVQAALDKAGAKASDVSIQAARSATLDTLRLIQEHGMPKGKF